MLQNILILGPPVTRVNNLANYIRPTTRTAGRLISDLAEQPLRTLMHPRAINNHELRIIVSVNPVNLTPGGLWSAGDD
jgi:hypothetical protein